MINTKNIIVGIVGIFLAMYVVIIGLNFYTTQNHKNALENKVSRAVKSTLNTMYGTNDTEAALELLKGDILADSQRQITININAIDLEKGILSIEVNERFPLITGEEREIVVEKTVIMEKEEMETSFVTVTFMVDGEVYKEYQLEPGEECPMPKVPEGVFLGWMEYGAEEITPVEKIGKVWADRVYLAITE